MRDRSSLDVYEDEKHWWEFESRVAYPQQGSLGYVTLLINNVRFFSRLKSQLRTWLDRETRTWLDKETGKYREKPIEEILDKNGTPVRDFSPWY